MTTIEILCTVIGAISIILKMLADYYKTGEVTGKPYGTFAGKEIAVK